MSQRDIDPGADGSWAPDESVISIRHLTVSYNTRHGLLRAVDNASIELERGKIKGLVGESGCGKSTLGLAISRLLPEHQVQYSGQVVFQGKNILALKEEEVEKYRGTGISTIFQEPMTSLNPVYRIGMQIAEALSVKNERRHDCHFIENRVASADIAGRQENSVHSISMARKSGGNAARRLVGEGGSYHFYQTRSQKLYNLFSNQVIELLQKVEIPNAEVVAQMYPHELSGGMKQRAMIAMALAEKPSFLVADEPTTALDVTTQAQILGLIGDLARQLGMGVLLITHDLGVISAVADSVAVMYAGKIIEHARADDLFDSPLHPYTTGLMESFPRGTKESVKLKTIPGTVPRLGKFPNGCRFRPRCEKVFAKCLEPPALMRQTSNGNEHWVRCFLYGDDLEEENEAN